MFLFFHFRTCISAEAEPLLKSSGCYPLVNFTRPFCQNHGVTLSDYTYQTPYKQWWYNSDAIKSFDQIVRLGLPKISEFLQVDNETAIKCMNAFVPFICHYHFPSCEGTKSEYKKQAICRETCLNLIHICGKKIWDVIAKRYILQHRVPEARKRVHCELQPYRNAGVSPECWYSDLEKSKSSPAQEWTTNAGRNRLQNIAWHRHKYDLVK